MKRVMDIQELLIEMRREQREDHLSLAGKVDEGFKSMAASAAAHELHDAERFADVDKRIAPIENTRRTIRWLAATAIVALLGGAADFFFVHLPKLLSGKQ